MNITEIFEDYYIYIYNFALKLTCHPDDALDITQETFIKAWLNLHTLKREEALPKWLRSICYHEFLMKIRKQKKWEVLTDDGSLLEQDGKLLTNVYPLPEDEIVVEDEIKELQNGCFLAMVRKLSLHQRIAFSLVDMFGLNIEDVAEILNVTKGAAKGLLYRARMNIDSFFAGHCNLIYENNPCSCQAWIRFSSNRVEMQKKAQEFTSRIDYREKGYRYNEQIRRKILYLYSHMPEQKPSEDWYKVIIDTFKSS